jgi:OmpA-OmpF porin, OOP family
MKIHYSSSFLVLLSFVLTMQNLSGQSFNQPSEMGLIIGTSNYAGDIVKTGSYDMREFGAAYGVFYRANTPSFSWRFSVLRGQLSGDDRSWVGTDRIDRGFSFTSPLTEFAVHAEFQLLNRGEWRMKNSSRRYFDAFLFAGAGVALVNPKTNFNRSLGGDYPAWIAEDERSRKTTMLTIPVGLGVKYELGGNFIIGADFSLNPVFNDYLDGISRSADPEDNDWYITGGLSFAMKLNN